MFKPDNVVFSNGNIYVVIITDGCMFPPGPFASATWYYCKTDRIANCKSQRLGGRSLSGILLLKFLYNCEVIFPSGFEKTISQVNISWVPSNTAK